MKNQIITTLLILLVSGGISQTQDRESRGWAPSISQSELTSAKLMSELMPVLYPYTKQWSQTIDYVSVEIVATCDGKSVTSKSTGDVLTPEQIKILNSSDVGSLIGLQYKFKYKNPETNDNGIGGSKKEMNLLFSVRPDIAAQFPGGQEELVKYLKRNVTDRFPETAPMLMNPRASVVFIVNEQGEISNAKISKSSTNQGIDKLILDAMNKMPLWKPAMSAKGIKVKQEVTLNFPFNSGGC